MRRVASNLSRRLSRKTRSPRLVRSPSPSARASSRAPSPSRASSPARAHSVRAPSPVRPRTSPPPPRASRSPLRARIDGHALADYDLTLDVCNLHVLVRAEDPRLYRFRALLVAEGVGETQILATTRDGVIVEVKSFAKMLRLLCKLGENRMYVAAQSPTPILRPRTPPRARVDGRTLADMTTGILLDVCGRAALVLDPERRALLRRLLDAEQILHDVVDDAVRFHDARGFRRFLCKFRPVLRVV